MKQLLILLIGISLSACNHNSSSSANTATSKADMAGYTLESLQGSDIQQATKKDENGLLTEVGFFKNGKKTGTWTAYHKDKMTPKTITSYINGALNGTFIEFNDRGQMISIVTYKDNVYHGPFGRYKFNRPLEEANFSNNKLNGLRKVFYENTGKIQAETEYKDGVQHGAHRNYNEAGQVILEYVYENGEKVSGQTFTPPPPEK